MSISSSSGQSSNMVVTGNDSLAVRKVHFVDKLTGRSEVKL